jgi:hypothetical protein
MADAGQSFVAEHPYLALLGAAVVAAAVDVAVSIGFGAGVDPLSTGLFVLLFTGLYAALLYRAGHLRFST